MNNRQGMTLIEVIMAVVVIGLAFYSVIALYITLAPRTARVENINTKVYLAQEKIEETIARQFANISSSGPTSIESPGLGNYSYQIVVAYVATSDLNTAVGGPTPYKNVKTKVWGGPLDQSSTVEIISLAASYEVK